MIINVNDTKRYEGKRVKVLAMDCGGSPFVLIAIPRGWFRQAAQVWVPMTELSDL